MDIDGTLCPLKSDEESYDDLLPYPEMIEILKSYRKMGFEICLHTSRHMRTCKGDVSEILRRYSESLKLWLKNHGVPYDELIFGKPWPGPNGFYVDDRSIRPDEFRKLSYEQIQKLVKE